MTQIVLDPGFGFSKTVEQNFRLLGEMHRLGELGYPVLAGISRKSMIYKTLDTTPDDALAGTTALHWECLRQGASILRVHDTRRKSSRCTNGTNNPMTDSMIRTKEIRKSFGTLEVLKGIDLLVERGEVVSIVGPSGAGKTTLLQILGTLSRPSSGEIEIDGEAVHALSDRQLSRFRNTKIGFVFQFHHLLPEFTALENVCIPGYIGGRDRREVEKRAAELLEMLGMEHRSSHKPAELSGGEQQRVAIARALINSPAVLLADEPSGNLDTKNREEIHRLFFTLRDTLGQTVVIVTHDGQLAAMSDRKIEMVDGQIVR